MGVLGYTLSADIFVLLFCQGLSSGLKVNYEASLYTCHTERILKQKLIII